MIPAFGGTLAYDVRSQENDGLMSLSEQIETLANDVRAKWLLIDSDLRVDVFMKMVAADNSHTWEALRLIAKHIDDAN